MKKLLLGMASLCLLLSPAALKSQTPNLGTAANFILFTTTGAITNTGISQVTGDVGTNTGAVTGFGNVNGIVQAPPNGATAQAAADLQNAYLQINAAIPTATPAPLLGNGQQLTAGVYHITGVATLAGDLILDAQGNSSALFIFQLDQAFSSSFGAKVKLVNGAQACNVFWRTEGLADFAAQTSFKGNLIAHNAAVAMNAADTIEGRIFSIAGAITLDGILAGTPAGCGAVVPAGPAAPNLGSAACFAVFSGNGPVTNSGVTFATGDIGTNVGLTTGYNPLNVTGMIHPIPDGVTVACKDDLLTAYGFLNLLPTDIQLIYPAQFGNDLVLTPHTYLLDAATALTGNVTLNGLGNANAIFVIKINGALSTSTFARVILTNGTQAKNVYWKVEGAVNISGNSVIQGTLISNNGAMSLSSGDSLNGRLLTTNGAVTTAASVVTIPVACAAAVPVKWLYFRGMPADKQVILKWGVSNEVNNDYYSIERSADGRSFSGIGTVKASEGTGSIEKQYTFTDKLPLKINYYRLSQTDLDGKKSYSVTLKIRTDQGNMSIVKYVSGNSINIVINGGNPGKAVLRLMDMSGRIVTMKNIEINNTTAAFSLPKPLQSGIYLINILQAESSSTEKIIIQ